MKPLTPKGLSAYTQTDMAGPKSKAILERVGTELKRNPPAILGKTRRKFGAKRASAQKTAILLNKARTMGASIPRGTKHG